MQLRQLTTEELRERELKILTFFHDYCKKYNLKYWLSAGSLIGAVRHQGFIPWDDDIDVAMPREDYMKLITIYPKEGIDGFQLLSPFLQEDCPITFGKLYETHTLKMDNEVEKKYQKYGVDIDIFPWDYSPDSNKRINLFYTMQYFRYKVFLGIVGKYRKEKKVSKTVIKTFFMAICKLLAKLKILNAHSIALSINKKAMKYKEGPYLFSSTMPMGRVVKGIAPKSCFENLILAEFEGNKFYIPSGYDTILKSIYGNYMELPPHDQQKTHHLSNVYEKE